jgi:tetratricopeptide (TPR) repeat protein
MKTVVFAILFLATSFGFSQGNVELTFSVMDADSEKKLDSAFIHLYRNDSLINSDSSGFSGLFGGHFKSFWLESGHHYKFVVSKKGFVSKFGTVDTHHEEADSLPYRISFPCFVTLFPDCDIADYSFLKTTSLINLYIDKDGKQAWDKEYVNEMKLKISAASHAKIADDIYNEFSEAYHHGQQLIEFQMYDLAMVELLKAKEIVDCYRVNRAIQECNERADGLYDKDTLLTSGNRFYERKNYGESIRLYERLVLYYPDEKNDVLKERMSYLFTIRYGEQNIEKESFEDAVYFFDLAVTKQPDDTYPVERLAVARKLLKEKQAYYDGLIVDADSNFNDKNYENARKYYEDAKLVFPNERYPNERLREIRVLMKKKE